MNGKKNQGPQESPGKKCTKCHRPIKGHQIPRGKSCSLEPVLTVIEEIEEQQKALEKNRKRMSTPQNKEATRKRMASSENTEATRKRLASSENKEATRTRMATSENKEATRKRMASSENKEATKRRLATNENKDSDRKRKAEKIKTETRSQRKIRLENKRKSSKLARQRKKKAFGYEAWSDPMNLDEQQIGPLNLPNMTMECSDCNALMFPFEIHRKKSDGQETFSLCCSYGNVSLPSFQDPPQLLQDLLTSESSRSKVFRLNIRTYNSLLSMASRNITGKETDFSNSRGPPVFKISGSMFHLTPNVLPDSGQEPKFAQIYVYDREQQIDARLKHVRQPKQINKTTLGKLQDMLQDCNFYVQRYQAAAEIFASRPTEDLRLVMKSKGSKDVQKKTFMPDVSDVVVIAPGDQTERRDVVLYKSKSSHPKGNDTVHIHELNKSYDPTAYVLILPKGDDGYSIPPPLKKNSRPLTAMDYYSYHLMVRDSCFNTLHRTGRLYQEYLCDMYSKVEVS